MKTSTLLRNGVSAALAGFISRLVNLIFLVYTTASHGRDDGVIIGWQPS